MNPLITDNNHLFSLLPFKTNSHFSPIQSNNSSLNKSENSKKNEKEERRGLI